MQTESCACPYTNGITNSSFIDSCPHTRVRFLSEIRDAVSHRTLEKKRKSYDQESEKVFPARINLLEKESCPRACMHPGPKAAVPDALGRLRSRSPARQARAGSGQGCASGDSANSESPSGGGARRGRRCEGEDVPAASPLPASGPDTHMRGPRPLGLLPPRGQQPPGEEKPATSCFRSRDPEAVSAP